MIRQSIRQFLILLALATSVASAATYVHTTSATLHAYPRSNADFSDWATEAVELVEDGSTGIYEGDLHRGWGETWMVFTSDPPSAWSEAVGVIELPWEGPFLDLTRDTPYGIQVDTSGTQTNIALPINWAFRYCHEPDPESRTPPGGPRGCFRPSLASNDSDSGVCWSVQTGIHIPAGQAGLELQGMGRGSANTVSNNGLGARLLWEPDAGWESYPMVLNQGNNVTISGVAFLGRINSGSGSSPGRAAGPCLVSTRIQDYDGGGPLTIADHPYYREGFTQDQGSVATATTELKLFNCAFSGWNLAIQNGGQLIDSNCDHGRMEECFFWDTLEAFRCVNSQGVDFLFTRNYAGTQTQTMYNIQAGGKMRFTDHTPATSSLKFLNIGTGPTTTNGFFVLDNITFDAGVGAGGYLVFMEDRTGPASLSSFVQIVVRGGQDSFTGTRTSFVHLESNTDFSISGWKRLGPITTDALNTGLIWRPRVLISDCMIQSSALGPVDVESLIMLSDDGSYQLRTRDVSLNTNGGTGTMSPRPQFARDVAPDGFPVLSK